MLLPIWLPFWWCLHQMVTWCTVFIACPQTTCVLKLYLYLNTVKNGNIMKTLIKKGGKLEEYIKIRNSKGLGNTLFSSVVLANGGGDQVVFHFSHAQTLRTPFWTKNFVKYKTVGSHTNGEVTFMHGCMDGGLSGTQGCWLLDSTAAKSQIKMLYPWLLRFIYYVVFQIRFFPFTLILEGYQPKYLKNWCSLPTCGLHLEFFKRTSEAKQKIESKWQSE